MTIVKSGRDFLVTFDCPVCGCEYEMDQKEFVNEGLAETEDRVMDNGRTKLIRNKYLKCMSKCPNCGYEVHNKYKV